MENHCDGGDDWKRCACACGFVGYCFVIKQHYYFINIMYTNNKKIGKKGSKKRNIAIKRKMFVPIKFNHHFISNKEERAISFTASNNLFFFFITISQQFSHFSI